MDLVLEPIASAGLSTHHHAQPTSHNPTIPALMDIVLDAETLGLCNHIPLCYDPPSINSTHYAKHSAHNPSSCSKSNIPALMDLVLDPLVLGLQRRARGPSIPKHRSCRTGLLSHV